MRKEFNPVIVLGMHRSGTTLLVNILKEFGIFFGARLEENMESMFFLRINEWLLKRSGGSWDNPLPIKYLLNFNEATIKAVDLMKNELDSLSFREYIGVDFDKYKIHGWKDPRNIFTIKLWLNIFKEAKIIYICRNGIDVANSLHVRARSRFVQANGPLDFLPKKRKFKSLFTNFEPVISDSLRCCDFIECFKLWEEYVCEADKFFSSYGGKTIHLSYEDFILNPENEVKRILEFVELESSTLSLKEVCGMINKERAYSFFNNSELVSFYNSVKDSFYMKKLGYSNLL